MFLMPGIPTPIYLLQHTVYKETRDLHCRVSSSLTADELPWEYIFEDQIQYAPYWWTMHGYTASPSVHDVIKLQLVNKPFFVWSISYIPPSFSKSTCTKTF